MNPWMRRAVPVCLGLMAVAGAGNPAVAATQSGTYNDDEVAKQASEFFSSGAKELSDVLAKVLKDKGQPVAIIRGEEAGGAIGVGLRYGRGELEFKDGARRMVYWQGPSIGFDVGANAVKVFTLVYKLPDTKTLFKRYPSVEGSLYFVGGFGVNYLQSGSVSLAPVRFGVGWRQGINLGYLKFTAEKSANPF
jgi:hypothetical protein